MSEGEVLFCASIIDANGVIIDFDIADPINAEDLLIPALSKNEGLAFLRPCEYIAAKTGIVSEINPSTGKPENKTTLAAGSFAVNQRKFLQQFKDWYDLKRVGREWYTRNKSTTASWIKQRMQAALLPFGIPQRELTALYQLLITQCNTAATVTPLSIVKASDLNTQVYKRPPFIVSGFLCAGLTLLAAPPKTGKSFLVLDLACSIAEGKPFWGFPTTKGSVLYCDLEGTPWRTQERFQNIGRASRTDCPELLSMTYNAAPVDAGLIEQLAGWIDSVQDPRLIIIDTIAHVKGKVARGEDSYTADTRFMKPLHDLAVSKGIAIIAVTHTRKANGFTLDDPFDAVLGSTAQYGNSDAGWIIGGKRDEDLKKFTAVGRDFEPVSFEIERSAGGRWIYKGTSEENQAMIRKANYEEDKLVQFLKWYLPRQGGRWDGTAQELINIIALTKKEYIETDPTRMSKKIRGLAPQLTEDGIIVVLPEKSGGKNGRKFIFQQQTMI